MRYPTSATHTIRRGDQDAVVAMYRLAYEGLGNTVPNLRAKVLLEGAGHWVQQERPAAVNQLAIDFLTEQPLDEVRATK